MSTVFYYLFLTLCAILPPLIFLAIIWAIDKDEKEPIFLILTLFSVGALSCLPIAFMELFLELFNIFEEGTIMYAFVENFMIVAFSEELGKFLILLFITWWSRHFNYKYDAIVYAVAVSLGFATLENVLYVLSSEVTDQSGFGVAVMRMLMAIPGHFTDGVFMGLFYGFAKEFQARKKTMYAWITLFATLFIPMCLHGFYDFCLSSNSAFLLTFIPFIIIVDIAAIVLIAMSIKNDKLFLNLKTKNVNYAQNNVNTKQNHQNYSTYPTYPTYQNNQQYRPNNGQTYYNNANNSQNIYR